MTPVAPTYSYLNFIFFLLGICCLVGFFWSLVNVLRSDFKGNGKLIWTLVVLPAPFGWMIYLLMGRKQRLSANNS